MCRQASSKLLCSSAARPGPSATVIIGILAFESYNSPLGALRPAKEYAFQCMSLAHMKIPGHRMSQYYVRGTQLRIASWLEILHIKDGTFTANAFSLY